MGLECGEQAVVAVELMVKIVIPFELLLYHSF
jgi:hypothetical protein